MQKRFTGRWRRYRLRRHVMLAGLVLALLTGPGGAVKSTVAATAEAPPDAPEVTVCGALRERLAFWSWSSAAGSPDPGRVQDIAGVERLSHTTRDGRRLRGYRLASRRADQQVRRSVLVAGGNAMLADQLVSILEPLAANGLELFIFDYRGYGASEGKPRLLAIIGDHVELAHLVAAQGGGPPAFYGISMGGIVLANALSHLRADAYPPAPFVIDGSPARISTYGCPERFDPLHQLPGDKRHIMFIGGGNDTVVPLADSRPLYEQIEKDGGRVEIVPELGHPFNTGEPESLRQRLELVRDFLAAGAKD